MASLLSNQATSNSYKLSFLPQKPSPMIPSHSNPKPLLKTTLVSCTLHHRSRPEYIPGRISDPNYVRTLDTTLRDGEQAAGASLSSKEKLLIAKQLRSLGVDIIEAGFPAASKEDFEAVRMIAKEVGTEVEEDGYVPVICVLARCNEKDIEAAWDAVKYAKRPRINTFVSTSEIHMKYKLRKRKEEVIQLARRMVAYAKSLGFHDLEFGSVDSARSEKEFLYEIFGEAIKAGATTLNVADTVGYMMPSEFGELIADIKANTPGIENAIISTHCHNDLGLSTANTLAGAYGGARQVEVTINGIGERAGNASLEEVVMAIKCRGESAFGGLYTAINPKHLYKTSKMVEEYSGMPVQPNKAIIGANAFAHESGIHQDGFLKHKSTYEIISPEDIGVAQSDSDSIVLGKLSGRRALKYKLKELGYDLDDEQVTNIFRQFKAIAETKKRVTDEDLRALVAGKVPQAAV